MESGYLQSKYKIVFLGDSGVGKTSIINKYTYSTYDPKIHVHSLSNTS
jgi:GTPase SAR1 family protein